MSQLYSKKSSWRYSVSSKFYKFKTNSPDNLALVNFAKFCGVKYEGKDKNNMIRIKFKENVYHFLVL